MARARATERRRFTVTLESSGAVDDFRGFRRWLKRCVRDFALRAVDITTTPALPAIGEHTNENPQSVATPETVDSG